MSAALDKLLSIGSASLSAEQPQRESTTVAILTDHQLMLQRRNGFFAFESALCVFPDGTSPKSYALAEWNAPDLWRRSYGDLIGEAIFFAEDAFGSQFCFADSKIAIFDPETTQMTAIAVNLEEWAERILEDYNYLTGYSLIHEWQASNGPVPPRYRLAPKIPFVCGGAFALSNLALVEAAEGMRFRGHLAQQIRSLPDGAMIRLVVKD